MPGGDADVPVGKSAIRQGDQYIRCCHRRKVVEFYRLEAGGEMRRSLMSGAGYMVGLLGQVRAFFELCEHNLV